MKQQPPVALVSGANRGMGLETCRALAKRGYQIILTSRDQSLGQKAAESLAKQKLSVTYFALDVTDTKSVQQLKEVVEQQFGGVDVLVNNAGIYPDQGRSVLEVELETFQSTMATNFYGPLLLCQAWVPGMIARGYGRVVNVSSGLGQLSSMGNYAPAYSASKAALNALTRMVADAAQGANVLVNAVDPGWVRTHMGGPSASRSVEQGIDTIVWLATLPDGGPTGGFFHDRQLIAW